MNTAIAKANEKLDACEEELKKCREELKKCMEALNGFDHDGFFQGEKAPYRYMKDDPAKERKRK